MIHVERPPLSHLPALASILANGRDQVAAFLAQPHDLRAQRRAPTKLRDRDLRAVGAALYEVFDGKCAYCETSISPEDPTFGRFWPESAYPQRAFDWDNVYLCCSECNLYKSNRFPFRHQGATRGAIAGTSAPLLLDPCVDQPEQSLKFLADGSVEASDDAGIATIDTFVLNRPSLVERRKRRALEARQACARLWTDVSRGDIARSWFQQRVTESMARKHLSHVAVVRATALQFLIERGKAKDRAPVRHVTARSAEAEVTPARWPHTVKIENFKAIKKLTLEFAIPKQNRQPWLMLLGENGVGKSTVLQAVALAMTGGQGVRQPAHAWLRRGARRGHVRLIWNDGSPDFVLRFQQNVPDFVTEGTAPNTPVLAYGATRLLPDETGSHAPERRPHHVANLFDPREPLAPVQAYLCDRKAVSQEAFDRLAYSLIQLLDLDEKHDRIIRRRHTLGARIGDRETSFADLSGGRKSMLALAMDIMFNLAGPDGELRHLEGLVLLDEIELHLHARWKVKIARLLREMFPTIRFIATTHDPLCANGLEDGELQVMVERPHDRERDVENINIPRGARTDDILTGPWFGLQSTMDDDTVRKMSAHSALLQLLDRDEAQTAEMRRLEQELRARLGSYGDTQAQRAVLAVNAMMRDVLPESRADQISRVRLRARLAADDGEPGNA